MLDPMHDTYQAMHSKYRERGKGKTAVNVNGDIHVGKVAVKRMF